MEKQKLEPKYGFLPTISLVIGCVIGSGIFFKVDDILLAAKGNNLAGLIGWIVVGFSVISGAIALSYYAIILPKEGGLIKYSGYRFGKKTSFFVGWFYMTIYFPILSSVLFTVAGIYMVNLAKEFIDFQPNFLQYTSVGIVALLLLFYLNLKKPKAGAIFQSASTILKVIPLLLIATIGIVHLFKGDIETVNSLSFAAKKAESQSNLFLLAAATFIPIAFAFDGWYVATQISGEVKNPKRNLPLALITGTLIVTFIYVFYYLGIVFEMGSEEIITQKDAYITGFSRNIAGDTGAILMQLAIIISVLGASNALLIGALRVPYQLVNSGNSHNFFNVLKIENKSKMPMNSAYFSLGLIFIYIVIFYLTNTVEYFIDMNFDLSSIPITFVYIINLGLYLGLIKLVKKGEIKGNKLWKYLIISLAIFGAIIVLIGGITTSNGALYISLSLGIMAIGYKFLKA